MSIGQDINTARRLIIHCGVQKTGSTSLHRFVGRNRDQLRAHLEILTPIKGTPVQKMGRAAMQFSLDPSPKREKTLTTLIRGVRDQLAQGSQPILISHENLPGAMPGKDGVTTLYPNLERIVELLEIHFAPFVPDYVFFTREMGAWKKSVHNQAVKSDHYTHPWPVFKGDTANCGSWNDLERRMTGLVGKSRVRFFRLEDESDAGKPGQQLLRFAGLGDGAIDALTPMAQPANQSLNAGSLEFLRRVNAQRLERGARRKIAELVRDSQTLFVVGGHPS